MASLFDVLTGSGSVPENLLQFVPPDQRQAVLDQAQSNYMKGFLATRGGLLSRLGGASATAENTVKNYLDLSTNAAQLQNAQRDAGRKAAYDAAIKENRNPDGSINYNALVRDPRYTGMLDPGQIYTQTGPDMRVVEGRIVDARNPSNQNRPFVRLGEGQTEDPKGNIVNAPGYLGAVQDKEMVQRAQQQRFNLEKGQRVLIDPASGREFIVNADGYVSALQEQEAAKAKGQAAGQVEEVFDPASGRMVKVPRTQLLGGPGGQGGGGGGGGPTFSGPSEGEKTAASEGAKSFNTFKDEAGLKAQNAGTRIMNAQILAGLTDRFDTNNLAPIKAEIGNYMRGLGISNDQIDRYTSDVKTFMTFREQKLRDDVSMFKGSQSDRELGVLQQMGQAVTKPADLNKFYSAFEVAQANRDRQIADAISRYQGKPDRIALQQYIASQPFMQQSLFADPSFRGLSVGGQPVVVEQEYQGRRYLRVPMTKTVIPLN